MKYLALLSGGKDSCYNLVHCAKNGHELVAAASLRPGAGKGLAAVLAFGLTASNQQFYQPRGTRLVSLPNCRTGRDRIRGSCT
jgi:hypothetical protein